MKRPSNVFSSESLRYGFFSIFLFCLLIGTVPSFAQRPSVELASSASSTKYTNLVNERFATVSSGPQSSLIVDVRGAAPETEVQDAVTKKARAAFIAQARLLSGQAEQWERAGLIKPGTMLPLSSLVVVRKNGRLVLPERKVTRQVGGGTLTFRYTGFNDTDRELLQGFLATAYPIVESVYGRPATTAEIEIVNAGNLATSTIPETRRFAYGVYDVSNNRILLPIFRDPRGTLQAVLLNLIHAFHGPAVFQYDVWEQGFARAAASVVLRDPIFNQRYNMDDPSGNSLFSLMRFYDLLNQPPLGNSTFFPPSQRDIPIDGQITVAKMLWARIGMSGATWLKVYAENPAFFRDFNAAYYAQFDPAAPNLAGNVPQLKTLAATLLPNGVEGLPWNDWFARQFVLDTSIAPGTKLYAFAIPGLRNSEGRQNHSVTLVYYRTEKSGDETLLNGQAYGTYIDATNSVLSLGVSSERAMISNGEGGLTVTTTNTAGQDATRLTMDFSIGSNTARVYLPIGFEGDVQGVLLAINGANRITVRQRNTAGVEIRNRTGDTVEEGAFGVPLGMQATDVGSLVFEATDGTTTRTWRVNVADDSYYAILRDGRDGGGVVTLSRTFAASSLPYLVSFPVQPLSTEIASALGLSGSDFLLSYWDAGRSLYETFVNGQPSVSPIRAGRGYWLKVSPTDNTERTVRITGIPPASDTDFSIACPFGWNLIGSPFSQAIDMADIRVKFLQNDPVDWETAVEQNLVAAQPFALNRENGQYSAVNALSGDQWQGYWLRVLAPGGVTLLLPGPTAPTRAYRPGLRAEARRQTPEDKRGQATVAQYPLSKATVTRRPVWQVALTARQTDTGRELSAGVTLGAAKGATRAFDNRWDTELPPAIVPGLTMEFPHRDWRPPFGCAGGRFASDFRENNTAHRETWDVQLTTPFSGPVTLAWNRDGTLPRRANLVLVDKETGERVSLKSRSAYTFTATGGQTRAFQIVAETAPTLPLTVTNIVTVPTRAAGSASGLSITYNVSRAADVQIEVATLTGKIQRRLAAGRSQTAGQQRTHWDGRGQNGVPLPPGPYLLTITARDDEGRPTEARRVVTLLQ